MSKTRSRKARSLFASQWAELLIGIESSEKYAWKYRLGLYSEDFEYKDEWPMFSVNNGEVSSVQFSCSVVSDTLRPHESQHTRPPCPSPSPGVHSDSCPSSPWCHPAISSSVIPFSSCPQSLPASESFPVSQLFTWGGQSIRVSALASFLLKKSQGWSLSEWTVWISLLYSESFAFKI